MPNGREQLLKESLRSLHLLFCSGPGNKSYSKIASVIKNYKPDVSSSTVYPAVSYLSLPESHRELLAGSRLSSFVFVIDAAGRKSLLSSVRTGVDDVSN